MTKKEKAIAIGLLALIAAAIVSFAFWDGLKTGADMAARDNRAEAQE